MSLMPLLLVVISPSAMSGEICVEVDADRDTLEEADRRSAFQLFESALRQEGGTVVDAPCPQLLRLHHLKLGKSVQVIVRSPSGEKVGKATVLEDLPAVYNQLAQALISGSDLDPQLTTRRDSVTRDQAAPRRTRADSLFYTRLGMGSVLAGDTNYGPSFGLGLRYELDQLAIDASLNMLIGVNDDSNADGKESGLTGSLIQLRGLWFFRPAESFSPYAGGGLSWGGTAVTANDRWFSGGGLQGEVSAGLEFLRSSTIRFFVEANGTLPFYNSDTDSVDRVTGERDRQTKYTPSISLSLGLGWGGSSTTNHNVTHLN